MSTASRLEVRPVDHTPPLIYGPVSSRRFGRSLGINLMPPAVKLCNFDCLYCQCGATEARRREPEHAAFPSIPELEGALVRALQVHRDVQDICFAGNGEPTTYPEFRRAVEVARGARDRFAPGARLSVLSNGTTAARSSTRAALALLDRKVMKLDAAVEELFHELDGPPSGLRVRDLVAAYREMDGIHTQTMLVQGRVANATPEALISLGAALREIRPVSAQLMTISRSPAQLDLEPLGRDALEAAAAVLRREAPEIQIDVY